jgi:hypothetical protein
MTLQREMRHWNYEEKEQAKQAIADMRAEHALLTQQLAEQRDELTVAPSSATVAKKSKGFKKAKARQEVLGRDADRQQRRNLVAASATLDVTDDHLSHTEYVLAETVEVGAAASTQLRQQREQLLNASDNTAEMNSLLIQSRSVLNRMRRRIVANKMIQAFIIFLQLGIIALIIYFRYYYDK